MDKLAFGNDEKDKCPICEKSMTIHSGRICHCEDKLGNIPHLQWAYQVDCSRCKEYLVLAPPYREDERWNGDWRDKLRKKRDAAAAVMVANGFVVFSEFRIEEICNEDFRHEINEACEDGRGRFVLIADL